MEDTDVKPDATAFGMRMGLDLLLIRLNPNPPVLSHTSLNSWQVYNLKYQTCLMLSLFEAQNHP